MENRDTTLLATSTYSEHWAAQAMGVLPHAHGPSILL